MAPANVKFNETKVQEILNRVVKLEQEQYENWLPGIETCFKHCDLALEECTQIDQIAEEFKTAPAQYCIPNYKVRGKTLAQWQQSIKL